VIDDLELMGLVETWVESRGREGRVKQVETTFDPKLVWATENEYVAETPTVKYRGDKWFENRRFSSSRESVALSDDPAASPF
jgi:hypothetical protein